MLTTTKIEIETTSYGIDSLKFLLDRMNRTSDMIYDINDMTPVKIIVSKDRKNITIEGPIVEGGRIVYFMGGTLDIDTGYMLSSYGKEAGFALFNLYDFLFLQDPQFDKEEFLLNLEDLKLNEIGNKCNFDDVVRKLFSTENVNNRIDENGSISKKALKTLQVESKNGATLMVKRDDKFYDKLAKELMLNVSAYLDFRRILNRFITSISGDSDKLTALEGRTDPYFKVVSDEFNILSNAHIKASTVTSEWITEKLPAYTYLKYYNSLDPKTQEEFSYTKGITKFLSEDANWMYDRSYDSLRSYDKKPKEGKAERLFNNLKELLGVSKNQDDEIELYNTLTEDYDVAKKAIKKTSFKDIIKGSYLTNVLKNVSTFFRSEPVANPVPDISRDIAPVLINELTRINNHFVTLIRKALSLL